MWGAGVPLDFPEYGFCNDKTLLDPPWYAFYIGKTVSALIAHEHVYVYNLISIEFAAKIYGSGHINVFLLASRFQFVAIGQAKILKIGQEIMSLWQKIILNRVFAVAREIIYEHKFSVYTIFLTRLKHSNFNTCVL